LSDDYTRRQFFGCLVEAMEQRVRRMAAQAVAAGVEQKAAPSPQFLRPPGALNESAFLKTCTRCTDCIEACPYDSIRRLGDEFGNAAGTPAIIPDQSPCYLCEDMPCVKACPADALIPTMRNDVRMATAAIDRERCYQAMGQPCDYCVTRCPLKSEAIMFGDDNVPVINAEYCTGCATCAYLCPAEAVRLAPVKAERYLTA